jgi:hypothetical protein
LSTNTPNYNLVKPTEATDLVDVDLLNNNSDIIDTALHNHDLTNTANNNRLNVLEGTPKVCRVSRAAAQSLANNTISAIIFDTEVEDTDTMFSASSSDVVIKTAGLYLISGSAGLNAGTSSRRMSQLAVNGAGIIQNEGAPSAAAVRLPLTTVARLAINDVITFLLYQNSGVALNTLTAAAGSADPPQLQVVRLGA